jgi:hypothetical protein
MRTTKYALHFIMLTGIWAILASCSSPELQEACLIDDESYCDFMRELEPLVAAQDVAAILSRVELRCCMGDLAPSDALGDPEFDADEECVRSGVILGEGSCTPVSKFGERWAEDAPFKVSFILLPEDMPFESASIRDGPAVLVSTGDPEWDLVIATKKDGDDWVITAIVGIRKEVLIQFPAETFLPWPPGSPTLIAPPYVTPRG